MKNGSIFQNVSKYLFYRLTYITIWLNFVSITNYRAKKGQKIEKKICLFSTVTETFLHRLRVDWCG